MAEAVDRHVDGAALWEAAPVVGTRDGVAVLSVSPAVIAVYGASAHDEYLGLFVDRHGVSALAPAVAETVASLCRERTRCVVADWP